VRVVKTIGQVEGPLAALSGVQVEGYEIHMGRTEFVDVADAGQDETSIPEEHILEEPVVQVGNVYGSYIHGIFDSQACGQAVVSSLLAAKGLDDSAIQAVDMKAYKETQYDKLADAVRASLDMELIYDILDGRR
jgi:adenosylcobyric acid synthase